MNFIDKIIKAIGFISAIVFVALVVLIVYDASVRYIFSEGSTALQELEWHFFDVVILFGIAYTMKHASHVRVDIFYEKYSQKTQLLVDIISSLFFILPFSFLIIYIGVDFVHLSFVQHEASSDPGGLKYRFLVKSLMPLAFVFLSLQAIRDIAVNFNMWKKL